MVNCEPYLALGVEHTAKVTPRHSKVWLRLDGFQVAGLEGFPSQPKTAFGGTEMGNETR